MLIPVPNSILSSGRESDSRTGRSMSLLMSLRTRSSRTPTNSRTYSHHSMRRGFPSRVSWGRRPFWHNQRAITTISIFGIKPQHPLWWVPPLRTFFLTSAETLSRTIHRRNPLLSMTRHRADCIGRLTAISSALRSISAEKRLLPPSQAGATR
jgi:hypothetical protein